MGGGGGVGGGGEGGSWPPKLSKGNISRCFIFNFL